MILARILLGKPVPTSFGIEYQAQFAVTEDAKSMSGQVGSALFGGYGMAEDDIVQVEYRKGPSYGLWFIVKRLARFK